MKKQIFASLVFAAGVGMSAQVAMARDFAEIYTECGLGAMIAPKHGGVAAVTNVTWDLGTTAVSSNISSPDTCVGGKEKTAAFINQSYENIEVDLAKGQGEYLDRLMALMGVREGQKSEVLQAIRSDMGKVVSSSSYTSMSRFEKTKALYSIVEGYIS